LDQSQTEAGLRCLPSWVVDLMRVRARLAATGRFFSLM